MELPLKHPWQKVPGTNIYTTGHYVIENWEIKALFESEIFDNLDNLLVTENNRLFSSQMGADNRIRFNFIPLRAQHKYLIEGNASNITPDEIKDILPDQIKRILIEKRRVRYMAG